MKPITHPNIKDITVEGILHAFADPARVQIFAQILAAECPQNCSAFLKVKGKELPKSSLSQHFKVLREAGLIRSERKGVAMLNSTRCSEYGEKFGPLVKSILDAYCQQDKKKKRAT